MEDSNEIETMPLDEVKPVAVDPAKEIVYLKHPHTNDVKELPADPAQLIPWLGRGYQQFHPANPVKGV